MLRELLIGVTASILAGRFAGMESIFLHKFLAHPAQTVTNVESSLHVTPVRAMCWLSASRDSPRRLKVSKMQNLTLLRERVGASSSVFITKQCLPLLRSASGPVPS